MRDRVPTVLLCLCALLVGALLRPLAPAAAQSVGAGTPAQTARYGIASADHTLYFVDSQTGRLWSKDTGLVLNMDRAFAGRTAELYR